MVNMVGITRIYSIGTFKFNATRVRAFVDTLYLKLLLLLLLLTNIMKPSITPGSPSLSAYCVPAAFQFCAPMVRRN